MQTLGVVTSNPTGINCGVSTNSVCSASFNGQVVFTATPNSGYAFNGWGGHVDTSGNLRPGFSSDCQDKSLRTCTITTTGSSMSLGVSWSLIDNTGFFDTGIFGWGKVTDNKEKTNCEGKTSYKVCRSQQPYTIGESVTFTAQQTDIYTFSKWTTCGCDSSCNSVPDQYNCGTNNPCTVSIPGTYGGLVPGISACFNPPANYKQISVTANINGGHVSSTPGKLECGTKQGAQVKACAYHFSQGTQVVLNAHPEPGYKFDGWAGHVTSSGVLRPGFSNDCKDRTLGICTITMPANDVNIGWFFVQGTSQPQPPTPTTSNKGGLYGMAVAKVNPTTGVWNYCAGPKSGTYQDGTLNSPISCGSDKIPVCQTGFRRSLLSTTVISSTEQEKYFTCEYMSGTTAFNKGGLYGMAVAKVNPTTGVWNYCAGPKSGTYQDGTLNSPISCGSDKIPVCQTGFRRSLLSTTVISSTEQEKYFTCESM